MSIIIIIQSSHHMLCITNTYSARNAKSDGNKGEGYDESKKKSPIKNSISALISTRGEKVQYPWPDYKPIKFHSRKKSKKNKNEVSLT